MQCVLLHKFAKTVLTTIYLPKPLAKISHANNLYVHIQKKKCPYWIIVLWKIWCQGKSWLKTLAFADRIHPRNEEAQLPEQGRKGWLKRQQPNRDSQTFKKLGPSSTSTSPLSTKPARAKADHRKGILWKFDQV